MKTVHHILTIAASLSAMAAGSAAIAAETIVTPASTSWSNRVDELRDGATAAITTTAAHSGNGSLEMIGARTRFAIGSIYPGAASASLATLSNVVSLTYDWMIATDSTNPYYEDYTPALRLHIWDAGAGARKELIWEGAYNDVRGPQTNPGIWYSTTASDLFYITGGDVNQGKTIADWASTLAAGSFVAGISVGSGGGAGNGFHVFADNVAFTTASGTTTFNFEAAADVPEPATWAMFIGGFGLIGGAMRRRATSVRFA